MTNNRLARILTTMEHWLDQTANDTLPHFVLDRDAVKLIVAALSAPAHEPGCDHVWGTLVSEGATGFTMTHSCEKCGAPGKVIVVPAEERQAEPAEKPVAYLKQWTVNGDSCTRVDLGPECEPWLYEHHPTITPLYQQDGLRARQLDTVTGIECMGWMGRHPSGLDTDDGLNRCPFCGHVAAFREVEKVGHDQYTVSVECTNTSCSVRTPQHYANRVTAAEAWNRRALNRQAEPKSERPDKDDAERYRWMRQHFQYGGFEQHRLEWYLPHRYGNRTPPLAEQLDQAIDEQRNALNRSEKP